jgi:hypothetical protein
MVLQVHGYAGGAYRRGAWYYVWAVITAIFEVAAICFGIIGAILMFFHEPIIRGIQNSIPAQTFVLSIEEEAKIQAEARRFINLQGLSNATLGDPTVTHCPAELRSRCYNYSGIDTTGQLYEAIVYVPLWKVGL